jgi:hypothetical protein
MLARPALAQSTDPLEDLARRAAIYLAPLSAMYARRFADTIEAGQKLNRLIRDTEPRDGLLSAAAWLDLSGEPLFLTLPAMAGRFYSAALLDPFTNNFAHVSSRVSGDVPKPHLIAGAAWNGAVPDDVEPIRAPAAAVWLRLRIAVDVDDEKDLVAARELQAHCLLETPDQRNERRIIEMRELMRFRTYPPPEPAADWPAPRSQDRFDLFDTALNMMGECVLTESDKSMLEELAPLKLHPGRRFDQRAFSETERRVLAAGLDAAAIEITEAGPSLGRTLSGWHYPAPDLGNFGTDYLYRAYVATTALGTAIPAEILELKRESDGSRARFFAPGPEVIAVLK